MRGALALPRGKASTLGLEVLLPAAITVVALLIYINSAFFSSFNAPDPDLSINLTAAHAIAHGQDPYGESTLLQRAKDLHSPTLFMYLTLFTSYIQPPTSAMAVLPLTPLSWRWATRAYLVLNDLMLPAALLLTLYTVRPSVPWPWAIAGAAVLLAGFAQVYASFALGQVDASMTLLLAIGLWGYSRGRAAVTGTAIAAGVAIKLIPVLLLLYFLWKREYRVVLWGIGAGAALFLLSFAVAGPDTYRTYFSDTLPALMKGSTHY
ncbi:MAG TPA: glycosyltransferase family 87 protein, partial [Dehalococcoidia bacterium]